MPNRYTLHMLVLLSVFRLSIYLSRLIFVEKWHCELELRPKKVGIYGRKIREFIRRLFHFNDSKLVFWPLQVEMHTFILVRIGCVHFMWYSKYQYCMMWTSNRNVWNSKKTTHKIHTQNKIKLCIQKNRILLCSVSG